MLPYVLLFTWTVNWFKFVIILSPTCAKTYMFLATHATLEVGIIVETLAPFQTNVSDFPYP